MNPYYYQALMQTDPSMLEMQASYLRYLAGFYAQPSMYYVPAYYPATVDSSFAQPSTFSPSREPSLVNTSRTVVRESFEINDRRNSNAAQRSEVQTEEPVASKKLPDSPVQHSPPPQKPAVARKPNP